MADVVNEISTLSIKLTMYRASDESTKTRTFSVRDPAVSEEESDTFRQSLQALQNFLLGDGKTLIQPTGWRDEDTTEDEYVTTAVEFTTEEGVGTKWDTRLTHNMALDIATINAASVSADIGDPTMVAISGTNLDPSKLIVSSSASGGYYVTWINTQGGGIGVGIIKTGSEITDSETFVFELPAEGVYQSDAVTLNIVGA